MIPASLTKDQRQEALELHALDTAINLAGDKEPILLHGLLTYDFLHWLYDAKTSAVYARNPERASQQPTPLKQFISHGSIGLTNLLTAGRKDKTFADLGIVRWPGDIDLSAIETNDPTPLYDFCDKYYRDRGGVKVAYYGMGFQIPFTKGKWRRTGRRSLKSWQPPSWFWRLRRKYFKRFCIWKKIPSSTRKIRGLLLRGLAKMENSLPKSLRNSIKLTLHNWQNPPL